MSRAIFIAAWLLVAEYLEFVKNLLISFFLDAIANLGRCFYGFYRQISRCSLVAVMSISTI